MTSCEKCWDDARKIAYQTSKSVSEVYMELVEERKNNPCTPEQQAGISAFNCPVCKRRTVHQYAKICMNCGKKY